jgi:hypothetical protein
MVRTFLKVYMELSSYFLFLQKQIKDIIIIICLSINITQYVFQWPGMEAATLPAAGSAGGFTAFSETVRAVYAATSWAARLDESDSCH